MTRASRIILWVVIILLSITLQSTVMHYFSLSGVYPNIVVSSVMVMALWYGRVSAIWGGFLTGLLLDIWAPHNLGLQALALTMMGALVGFFENNRINSGPIFQFFLFVLASTFHDLIILRFGEEAMGDLGAFIFGQAVPRALFTALFAMGFVFMGQQIHPHGRR